MSIALADVPGFPPEAADHLRIHVGIETIAALEDAVSRMGGMPSPRGDGIREPFTRLGVSAKFIDQATMSLIMHLSQANAPAEPAAPEKKPRKPRAKKATPVVVEGEQRPLPSPFVTSAVSPAVSPAVSVTTVVDPPYPCESATNDAHRAGRGSVALDKINTPAPGPADFTGDESPARIRPRGEPIPRTLRLDKSDTALDRFREWDREGRTPCDAVLVEWVGTYGDYPSGMKFITATRETVVSGIADSLVDWPTICTLFDKGQTFLVLMPPEKSG